MNRHPPLRIVFFGTPTFAVPALRALTEDNRYDVVLVVTQPDRPSGRGQRMTTSPVKQLAARLGLTIYQPSTLRSEMDRVPLTSAEADLFVVAAFGLIFGRKTLDIPRLGCVNLHASILPKYRGASPIAAAIAAGDDATGISLMLMDDGLDTGPVITSEKSDISPDDTTESLTEKLADVGAQLAVRSLDSFAMGNLPPLPQPAYGASVVRPLTKSDGWLDWNRSAEELERWVRAMWQWPRAWTTVNETTIQVHKASIRSSSGDHAPGTVLDARSGIGVQTANDVLMLETVQLPGGRPLPGSVLAASGKIPGGANLGATGAPEPQPPFIVDVPAS